MLVIKVRMHVCLTDLFATHIHLRHSKGHWTSCFDMGKTHLPQQCLSLWWHGDPQNHKDRRFCFRFFLLWCYSWDDPLDFGYSNYHFRGDKLTLGASSKLHARKFSRHGDQKIKRLMPPQVDCRPRSLLSADIVFWILVLLRSRSLSTPPLCLSSGGALFSLWHAQK